MAVKVAINGFGRIGRLAFRQMFGAEGYEVVKNPCDGAGAGSPGKYAAPRRTCRLRRAYNPVHR